MFRCTFSLWPGRVGNSRNGLAVFLRRRRCASRVASPGCSSSDVHCQFRGNKPPLANSWNRFQLLLMLSNVFWGQRRNRCALHRRLDSEPWATKSEPYNGRSTPQTVLIGKKRSKGFIVLLSKSLAFALLVLVAPLFFAQTQAVELHSQAGARFRFIVYGDTRFTDPADIKAASPPVRRALVQAIAEADPAFISVGGDIVYNGDDTNDWKVWDSETEVWRQRRITVYPALGNHDLHGNQTIALANYFQRFPALQNSRYYSVRAANTLMLVLDSSLDEASGPQGEWLAKKLDSVPSDVDFVFLVLHHPPYTASSDRALGGGHSARHPEQLLAQMLESRQGSTHARFVVFSGHVHNYEHHEHNGVTYFVTGGGGARPYPIDRTPDDPLNGKSVNYHYLLVEVDRGNLKITMHRLDLTSGAAVWTKPESVAISVQAAKAVTQGQ
jgi:acid phosphatase type 7